MIRKKLLKRVFAILGAIVVLVLLGAYLAFDHFVNPKSDEEIINSLRDGGVDPYISYRNFNNKKIRLLTTKKELDNKLPILVFIHGSPGSFMDFKRYLMDEDLNSKANLLAYDRPGYSREGKGDILASLKLEVELLEYVLKDFEVDQIILVGYSYGGTLVMASSLPYRKKIALAAAVRGELEPMYWALNLTQWELSKPFVPVVLQAAATEKFRHVEELDGYEKKWDLSPAPVLSIHGKEDTIVPYQNSLFLESLFGVDQFKLISLEKGNHSLIWTNFDLIKSELIKSIGE